MPVAGRWWKKRGEASHKVSGIRGEVPYASPQRASTDVFQFTQTPGSDPHLRVRYGAVSSGPKEAA